MCWEKKEDSLLIPEGVGGGNLKVDLTCMGRIALPQPSLQRAGPLGSARSAVAGSLSTCIFVYGHRQCRVSVSFLDGRKKDEQLFALGSSQNK